MTETSILQFPLRPVVKKNPLETPRSPFRVFDRQDGRLEIYSARVLLALAAAHGFTSAEFAAKSETVGADPCCYGNILQVLTPNRYTHRGDLLVFGISHRATLNHVLAVDPRGRLWRVTKEEAAEGEVIHDRFRFVGLYAQTFFPEER